MTLLDRDEVTLGVLHGVAVLRGNLVTPPQRHALALPREPPVAVLGVVTGLHVVLLALYALSLVTFLPLSANKRALTFFSGDNQSIVTLILLHFCS